MGVHEEIEAEKAKTRALIEAGKYLDAAKHLYADKFVARMRGTHVDTHQGIAALMERLNCPKTMASRTDCAKTYEMGPEHAEQVGHSVHTHKDGTVVNAWYHKTYKKCNGQWKIVCAAGGPESVHDEIEAMKKVGKHLIEAGKYLEAAKHLYADQFVMARGGHEPVHTHEDVAKFMEKINTNLDTKTSCAQTCEMSHHHAQQVGKAEYKYKDGKVVKVWFMSTYHKHHGHWKIVSAAAGQCHE